MAEDQRRFPPSRAVPGAETVSGLATLLLSAALLRFWRLGAQSLSTDEGLTWSIASAQPASFLEGCARIASPPLYYLLTAAALRLGDSEAHLRSVSVLASLGLVWLTYRLARLVAGRQTALLAAALTALSPFQIRFAQEARSDALAGLLTVASLYLFARAAILGRKRAWVPLALVTGLAGWTQNAALLGVVLQAVAMLTLPFERPRWSRWLLAMGGAALSWLPWLVYVAQQRARFTDADGHACLTVAGAVFQVLRAVFLSPNALVTLTALASVAIALGVATIRRARRSMAVAALLFLLSSYATFRYFTDYTQERWREVVEAIAATSGTVHAAVLVPLDADPFRYYNQRLAAPLAVFEISLRAAPLAWRFTPRQLDEMERSTRAWAARFDEIWVVEPRASSESRPAVDAIAHRVAASGRRLVTRERWEASRGPLRVSRYRATTARARSSGGATLRPASRMR